MPFANSHYAILGLHPSASVREIRRAYRELSKRYHPDTTMLPFSVATIKFQRLNEAYGVLSSPERRSLYDLKIGYSRWNVIQAPPQVHQTSTHHELSKSAYLDATERPLSGGEIFVLFILGLTLVGCLVLAIFIGILRGDEAIPPTALPQDYTSIHRIFVPNTQNYSSTLLTSL
ncbi:MAG: J domain-containing protein [Cyanobacteria bacterium P01_G01_bin.49]